MEALSSAVRQEEEEKWGGGHKDWIRKIKLSLFADEMIVYMENSQKICKRLLEQVSECIKVTGYKIGTHKKTILFFYANNEHI